MHITASFKMFGPQVFRQVARAARPAQLQAVRPVVASVGARTFASTSKKMDKIEDDEHDGKFARTDDSVQIKHPEEHEMPKSAIVQGRGGMHFKRTLATFSLDGKTAVVTGGARGLGLVMGQAIVESGGSLAIVDLNSEYIRLHQRSLVANKSQRRRPNTRLPT